MCRHGRAGDPQDHPYRHGRLLRVRRAARRSRAARQARGRGRPPARRGHGGELRGAQVRRALGHAVGDGQAAVPRAGVRQAALRRLQGGVAPDPRDLPRLHAAGRAAVARRGLSRRHDQPQEHAAGQRHRPRDPRPHPRAHRPHRLGRHLLQQVPGQARLRLSQAQRPDRDPAGEGPGLRRGPAGGQVPWRRARRRRRR